MYYTRFRIQNFKGIKDTTIQLSAQSKMGVFAFVGLNESGKTTILEAIHSFSPDSATSTLVGGEREVRRPLSRSCSEASNIKFYGRRVSYGDY